MFRNFFPLFKKVNSTIDDKHDDNQFVEMQPERERMINNTEEEIEMTTTTINGDNNNNTPTTKPSLQIIHSGGLNPSQDQYAAVYGGFNNIFLRKKKFFTKK